MKSQCLPFSRIPHTTRIFGDFLSYAPAVQPFYPYTPRFSDWFRDQYSALNYDSARRAQVCNVLERQNQNSPKTVDNIARLRSGAAAVVTGQQVGLFGGPLFSLFKALTTVKLAEQATAAGIECVPVFWLATEDHDLEEVNHIRMPGADAKLRVLATSTSGVRNASVGTIKFGDEIEGVKQAILKQLGESEIITLIDRAYKAGETFGSAFALMFSSLLSEWGVILLDASDAGLHKIAAPIYRDAVVKAAELDDALQARGESLEAAGYHQQVKVTSSSTLVFETNKSGARVPVHRHPSTAGEFLIGDEKSTEAELLDRIARAPQDFSPNVLLRPIVQDYLLPTLAYAGGPAEIAYFAQLNVVYEALLGRVTPIVPRFSATIVEPKQHALLNRYQLQTEEVFRAPEQLQESIARRAMPKAISESFDDAEAALQQNMARIRECLAAVDKTLVESAATAESKMLYQLQGLRSRAARSELRHSEVLARHAELLSNSIYPEKDLQEREIAGFYFLARHGAGFLKELFETIQPDCLDHQIIFM